MVYPSRLPYVLAVILLLTVQLSAQFSVNLPYQEVSVQTVDGKARFNGGFSVSGPGLPALPTYTVSFLLPPAADLKSVKVTISGLTEQILDQVYDVTPMPLLPGDQDKKNPSIVDGKNISVYNNNAFFPTAYLGEILSGSFQQYKMVTVRVYPYQYNPVSKKLRTITRGTLSVTHAASSQGSSVSARCERTEQMLSQQIVNPEIFSYYGTVPVVPKAAGVASLAAEQSDVKATGVAGNYYIVLTTNYIKVNCPELTNFLNATVINRNGLYDIITIENQGWQSFSGDARVNKIREFLRDNYQNYKGTGKQITNLLIIGSGELDNGDIPMKKLSETMVTDFYYADMDDPVGNTGDIAVGRIPAVYEAGTAPGSAPWNLYEIGNFLNRTTAYCLVSANDAEWRRTAMIPIVPIGEFQSNFGQNHVLFAENIVVKNINDNKAGWKIHRLYDPFDYNYTFAFLNSVTTMNPLPEFSNCNTYNVPELWNTLKPGLVIWNTHGSPHQGVGIIGTNDRGYLYDESRDIFYLKNGSVTSLYQDYPAIVFAASCHTAPPEIGFALWNGMGPFVDQLAYQTLMYNAVAYIGASRDIQQSANIGVAGGFATNMTNPVNNTVGEALNLAKVGADGEGRLLHNLWGCPNVALNLNAYSKTIAIPQNVAAYAHTAESSPQTQIQIRWSAAANATSYCIERGNGNASNVSGFTFLKEVTTLNYIDRGLTPATKYKYRVYSKSSAGRSPYSLIDSTTTYSANSGGMLKPQTPTLSSATPGDSKATLNFTPNSNGWAPTYFNIKRSTNSAGPFVTIASVPSTARSFNDTDLVNSQSYSYCVTACNNFGESGKSTVKTVTLSTPVEGSVPAPLSFSASANTDYSNIIHFSWQQPVFNYIGSTVEYQVLLPDGTYGGPWGDSYDPNTWDGLCILDRKDRDPNDESSGNNYTISTKYAGCLRDPRGGVSYKLRIRNFTHPGSDPTLNRYSTPLNFASTVTLPINSSIVNPEKPTWISYGMDGPEMIKFSWNYSVRSPYAQDTYYRIYIKDGSGRWEGRGNIASNESSYSMWVGRNKTIKVAIKAYYSTTNNVIEGNYSNVITITTDNQVIPPSDFEAQVNTYHSINLKWQTASAENPTFSIDRKIGTGAWTVNAYTCGQGETEKAITGLTPGTEYSFRMRALVNGTYSPYTPAITTKTYKATAQFTSPYEPNLAIDGIDNTDASRWAAPATTFPQSWQLDMGYPYMVYLVQIKWRTAAAWKYKIYGSNDGVNWGDPLVDQSNRTTTEQTTSDHIMPVPYRYFKVTVTGGQSGVKAGFYEFRAQKN